MLACSLLALSASGCVYGEIRQVLRAQVAAELKCPEVTVKQNLPFQDGYKENQYRVEGCGVTRTYECQPTKGLVSYDNNVCTYVAGDSSEMKKPQLAKDPTDAMNEAPMEEAPEPTAPASKPEAKSATKSATKAEAKQTTQTTNKGEAKQTPKASGRLTGKLSVEAGK